ncbi:MAG: hypothetical protein SFV18_21190, partial [Bryobacteraceae bacterium]|nr:hypothetical protein [Bryobacteraceae bacterium]
RKERQIYSLLPLTTRPPVQKNGPRKGAAQIIRISVSGGWRVNVGDGNLEAGERCGGGDLAGPEIACGVRRAAANQARLEEHLPDFGNSGLEVFLHFDFRVLGSFRGRDDFYGKIGRERNKVVDDWVSDKLRFRYDRQIGLARRIGSDRKKRLWENFGGTGPLAVEKSEAVQFTLGKLMRKLGSRHDNQFPFAEFVVLARR